MTIKKFHGFIDAHVHLREPGAIHKEDFQTGSRAAVKGGFTFVGDMPNNPIPTITPQRLKQKISLADRKAICDISFYYGTNGRNAKTFKQVWSNPRVLGLKIYCNHTTGDLLVNDIYFLERIFKSWESKKPILVHAENMELAAVVALANLYKRKLHVCHLSQAIELEIVRRAKLKGQDVTAGVCPHHLFLTNKDTERIKGYAMMKPPLYTKKDQQALWGGLINGIIDIVETDHAPHTKEEKQEKQPAFGVTGLETAVGLLFKAVKEKRLKQAQIVDFLYSNPKKIFNIPKQAKTYVEISPGKEWIVGEDGYESKCGWYPYDGWKLYGKIEKVVFKGRVLLTEGKMI